MITDFDLHNSKKAKKTSIKQRILETLKCIFLEIFSQVNSLPENHYYHKAPS